MNNLPSNIQYFLKHYSQKMTGKNQTALNAIRQSTDKFNKERCENVKLRSIEIYPFEDEKGIENELLYVIRVKGKKHTYYQGRVILFYMFVFDSFPMQPPQIIAGSLWDKNSNSQKRFLHLNVSESGQFCMKTNQKNEQYYEYTTLRDILLELQFTIYNPNIVSSYNNELFSAYNTKENNNQYLKLLNNQAKSLEKSQSSESSSEQN